MVWWYDAWYNIKGFCIRIQRLDSLLGSFVTLVSAVLEVKPNTPPPQTKEVYSASSVADSFSQPWRRQESPEHNTCLLIVNPVTSSQAESRCLFACSPCTGWKCYVCDCVWSSLSLTVFWVSELLLCCIRDKAGVTVIACIITFYISLTRHPTEHEHYSRNPFPDLRSNLPLSSSFFSYMSHYILPFSHIHLWSLLELSHPVHHNHVFQWWCILSLPVHPYPT